MTKYLDDHLYNDALYVSRFKRRGGGLSVIAILLYIHSSIANSSEDLMKEALIFDEFERIKD